MLFGFALGVLASFALVGMGFYWGLGGRSLVSLVSPWLGKLGAAGAFIAGLLRKWGLWR